MIVRLLVAAAVFVLALDGGSYSLVSRHSLAIVVWWVILLGVALGFWSPARLSRGAVAIGGLLALFACWTYASTAWAASAEKAFLEGDRVLLFLGVFLLVALAANRSDLAAWCDGLAVGLVAVALIALSTRFFPDLAPDSDLVLFLREARGRLTYPVEYWNGLGILVALALPLLLRAAVAGRVAATRGLAVAPVPALASTIYLTSSRGASLVAALGVATFLTFTSRRWTALAAFAVAAAGSVAAVAVLDANPDLANAVGNAAEEDGPTAAALIGLVCVATGAVFAIASAVVTVRPPRALGWGLVALCAGALAGAVVTFDFGARLETFKQTPEEVSFNQERFVGAHLLSGGGSGRWQFWSAAFDQIREHPVAGDGAGSYEAWWAQHGSFSYFVRDAHSLYLETLAELGIVGFGFLVAALLAGVITAGWTLRRAGPEHAAFAALTAAFVAYAVGAGIDWMWELTIVSIVGIGCLGLIAAAGTEARPRSGYPFAAGAAAIAAAWLIICLEALPLIAQLEIRRSQETARRGDVVTAVEAADTARRLEPWAASPFVQLALVHEQAGELRPARRSIGDALERDPADWRNWLIAARIQTKAGDLAGASRSLERAIELNPRSPLFRPG